MAKVLLVHGIRFKDKTVFNGLKEQLGERGVDAELVDYGYVLFPISNRRAVTKLKEVAEPHQGGKLVVVGYSNGAWASVQGAELGLHIDHLVLVNGALHVRHEFPGQVKSIDVFYSEGDVATRFAQVRRSVTRILPWRWANPHGWGAMGREGYKGEDERVVNHKMPYDIRHTFYRHDKQVERIADKIAFLCDHT